MPEASERVSAELRPAVPVAEEALREIAAAGDIGPVLAEERVDERTAELFFESRLGAYPGWRWRVAVALADGEVSVLETDLAPGPGALLAPEWLPWSDRLAEYRRQRAEQGLSEDEAADEHDADEHDADAGDVDDGVDADDAAADDAASDAERPTDADGVAGGESAGGEQAGEDPTEASEPSGPDTVPDAAATDDAGFAGPEPETKPKRRRFWQRRAKG